MTENVIETKKLDDSQPVTNDFERLKTPDDTTQEKAVLKGFKYTTDVIEKNGLIRVIRVTIGRKSTLEKIIYTYEVLEGIDPFISQLAVHGAKQKLCDSATGFKSESDKWDAMKYGQKYNFSKPFFIQFQKLLQQVPVLAVFNGNAINSEYANHAFDTKNSYLITAAWHN